MGSWHGSLIKLAGGYMGVYYNFLNGHHQMSTGWGGVRWWCQKLGNLGPSYDINI